MADPVRPMTNTGSPEGGGDFISVGEFFSILKPYRSSIGTAMAIAAFAIVIVALAFFLFQPSQKVTSLSFRLQFAGADDGRYPNGTAFSPSEIVASSVLNRVFEGNQLGRFLSFARFSESVFILEKNPALDALVREYEARLADPALPAAERDRLQREYETKVASLSRNDFSLNFAVASGDAPPQALIEKTLSNVLQVWSDTAVREKGVVRYDVDVLTTNIFDSAAIQPQQGAIAVDHLRLRAKKLIENTERLQKLPGANLVRGQDRVSLSELLITLDDLMRFGILPMQRTYTAALLTPSARAYFGSQIEYNETRAREHRERAASLERALSIYQRERKSPVADTGPSEQVSPQLSDSFLARLAELSGEKEEQEFRQDLTRRIEVEATAAIPYDAEVAHYRTLLAAPVASAASADFPAALATNLQEARVAAIRLQSIYSALSRNLNPSMSLYSIGRTTEGSIDRATSATMIALFALLTWLVLIPLFILFALLHHYASSYQRRP